MKIEVVGSAASGLFAVAGTLFAQHGTSWPAVIAALVGALLAVLELEDWRWRTALVILIFNAVIGAFAGPILTQLLLQNLAFTHPAAFFLIAFGVAYVAHDAFSSLKGPIVDRAAKWIRGGAK
ncbi:hypothetical protein [Shimia thalassica]|uniref:hypothetical protein n=1 Tax=Shimia thalassica TaxID=1715693 RepID=UPI0026E352E7|nr:hypothetical protein [Shimia thalassica]MDO6485325.1 hypothetical protein [Shimia thalassica]